MAREKIRLIDPEDFGKLGIGENTGKLYFDGKPFEFANRLSLTFWEKLAGFIVAAATVVSAYANVRQARAAADQAYYSKISATSEDMQKFTNQVSAAIAAKSIVEQPASLPAPRHPRQHQATCAAHR